MQMISSAPATLRTRDASADDFAAILALNLESEAVLSPLDANRLAQLHQESALHRVVEADGTLVAFLLVFAEGCSYDSLNYRWFAQRYAHFLYIDRVVVSRHARSAGAGTLLYRELFSFANTHQIALIGCEFDLDPPNVMSERFHARFGFSEVGRQVVADGEKVVSMQVRFGAEVFAPE